MRPELIDSDAFLEVVNQVAVTAPDMLAGEAVILGQYLSSLDIVTPEQEHELHEAMLRALVARGHRSVVFKPHPAAGSRHTRLLRASAQELGVRLVVAGESVPAEVVFSALRPELVVGCFSTGLVTASRYFGLRVASYGTPLVLERLTPYENSNRIPATIIDALLPRLSQAGELETPPAVEISELAGAVGYCMQSEAYPELRPVAEAYLSEHGTERYFKRQRLGALGLAPGGRAGRGRRRPSHACAAAWPALSADSCNRRRQPHIHPLVTLSQPRRTARALHVRENRPSSRLSWRPPSASSPRQAREPPPSGQARAEPTA
ncbi:polysialyltransferase family glycosyltransferase [Nonomuraea dietziae]|uniref:polysialyltransferase family glycosyltransferase n=1 Tax=Nonomuraea dietziae TaxID=65515 RepID=UPI0031D675F3